MARLQYQAPKLEVQSLRDLPSALAKSGCHVTPSKHSLSCTAGDGSGKSKKTTFVSGGRP